MLLTFDVEVTAQTPWRHSSFIGLASVWSLQLILGCVLHVAVQTRQKKGCGSHYKAWWRNKCLEMLYFRSWSWSSELCCNCCSASSWSRHHILPLVPPAHRESSGKGHPQTTLQRPPHTQCHPYRGRSHPSFTQPLQPAAVRQETAEETPGQDQPTEGQLQPAGTHQQAGAWRTTWAYPSGHRAKGGVHPEQVASPSQGHIETNETNNHTHSHSLLRTI